MARSTRNRTFKSRQGGGGHARGAGFRAVKRFTAAALVAALAFASGCFRISVEELYALPLLSEEYEDLQYQLDFVLSQDLEYSPPKGGDNRQAVQLVDIDGDGTSEVVAFFSATSGASLKAYIYKLREDGGYEIADILEGVGTGFESVVFVDMNGDGVLEIIIGWQMSDALRHMTLYSGAELRHTAIAEADYYMLTTGDLTGDGFPDLLLARAGTATVRGETELIYLLGAMVARVTARTSIGVGQVAQMTVGKLSDGVPALFCDGELTRSRLITDVFAVQDGVYKNILHRSNEYAAQTARLNYPAAVNSADISVPRDGIIETPVSVRMPLYQGTIIPYYALDWYNFDSEGNTVRVMSTLHDYINGWFLITPEEWYGKITVRRDDSPYHANEKTMIFSFESGGLYVDFLRIYTLTGDTRDDRARLKNRFRLYDDGITVYAAELIKTEGVFDTEPTEETVRTNFGKIPFTIDN